MSLDLGTLFSSIIAIDDEKESLKPENLKSEEEIRKYWVDEALNPVTRAIFLISSSLAVQRVAGFNMLPSLFTSIEYPNESDRNRIFAAIKSTTQSKLPIDQQDALCLSLIGLLKQHVSNFPRMTLEDFVFNLGIRVLSTFPIVECSSRWSKLIFQALLNAPISFREEKLPQILELFQKNTALKVPCCKLLFVLTPLNSVISPLRTLAEDVDYHVRAQIAKYISFTEGDDNLLRTFVSPLCRELLCDDSSAVRAQAISALVTMLTLPVYPESIHFLCKKFPIQPINLQMTTFTKSSLELKKDEENTLFSLSQMCISIQNEENGEPFTLNSSRKNLGSICLCESCKKIVTGDDESRIHVDVSRKLKQIKSSTVGGRDSHHSLLSAEDADVQAFAVANGILFDEHITLALQTMESFSDDMSTFLSKNFGRILFAFRPYLSGSNYSVFFTMFKKLYSKPSLEIKLSCAANIFNALFLFGEELFERELFDTFLSMLDETNIEITLKLLTHLSKFVKFPNLQGQILKRVPTLISLCNPILSNVNAKNSFDARQLMASSSSSFTLSSTSTKLKEKKSISHREDIILQIPLILFAAKIDLSTNATLVQSTSESITVLAKSLTQSKNKWRTLRNLLFVFRFSHLLFSTIFIHDFVVPFLFDHIKDVHIMPIRRTSCASLALILHRGVKTLQKRKEICERIKIELAKGQSYKDRILFLYVAQIVSLLFSRKFFKEVGFWHAVVDTGNDSVPNVRIKAVEMLPVLKKMIILPNETNLLKKLNAISVRLRSDADVGVCEACRTAIERMNKTECSLDKALTDDDLLDLSKAQCEDEMFSKETITPLKNDAKDAIERMDRREAENRKRATIYGKKNTSLRGSKLTLPTQNDPKKPQQPSKQHTKPVTKSPPNTRTKVGTKPPASTTAQQNVSTSSAPVQAAPVKMPQLSNPTQRKSTPTSSGVVRSSVPKLPPCATPSQDVATISVTGSNRRKW